MIVLLLVVAPLLLGLLIYLAFDGCTGWVWLAPLIGDFAVCDHLPKVVDVTTFKSGWVRFYVPDFLWAFSFAVCFTYLDDRRNRVDQMILYSVGVSPEAGQALGWLPGTADVTDLVLILLGCWLGKRCMERSFQ
jgi:hypothetical protein